MKLLVANRGEVAVRVLRAARERSAETVAVVAPDDASTHTRFADQVVTLEAAGPAAYLDREALLRAAVDTGCTHVHPGYGFLSEDPGFAAACRSAGIGFVGPPPETLEVFGDKVAARAAARLAGLPLLASTGPDAGIDEVAALLVEHTSGIVVKAQHAGGGRGLRIVTEPDRLAAAYAACQGEAALVSGRASVFADVYVHAAHHVEVQVLGDGGRVVALGDRDCSVQRYMQKLVEVAPAVWLDPELRPELHAAAVALCASVGYVGLGTVEFLVGRGGFWFLEVNPRLQVEHTVTEEVTGLDLVQLQLAVAEGATIAGLRGAGLGLDLVGGVSAEVGGEAEGAVARWQGTAIQCRVNTEVLGRHGGLAATSGTVTAFSAPSGAGVRVDTHLRPGAVVDGRYDTLAAKVIVHTPRSIEAAAAKAVDALAEFALEGVATNRDLLSTILASPDFVAGAVTTGWLESRLAELLPEAAVHTDMRRAPDLAAGEEVLCSQMLATVVSLPEPGALLGEGAEVVVLEAMKMHHALVAPHALEVARVLVAVGETVAEGAPLVVTRPIDAATGRSVDAAVSLDEIRPDLVEVLERHRLTGDEARSERLERMRARGRRSLRENIADLVDPGSFVEYAPLALAAQRRRRSAEELMAEMTADGLVAGTATIGAGRFERRTTVAVLGYDYSVAAGTQGHIGHLKTDRMLEIASRERLPVVFFAEGGGGRPNDSDVATTGITTRSFRSLAELSGKVPMVAVVSGRCFAGNASVAGACDVLIATPDSNIGMGGPAMIEGGGLGVVAPEEIGPIEVQRANGVVHLVAEDEADAVALARRYLGYFQGRSGDWEAPDPRHARHVVPEDRMRAYDVRDALAALADVGSVLELRRDWGRGIVTALARFEGRPVAVIANDSRHLGGAIDAEAARKATSFLRIARDFELPLLSLIDTPGFMVGPDAEREASVTHFAAMFTAGAQLRAPVGAIVLRKGYGLGVLAMLTGHVQVPVFSVAWPTGELGGMGLEGAIRLGARRQLEAVEDPLERQELFERLVAAAYENGKAMNAATHHELDDVIDPAESRRWIAQLFLGGDA